MGLDPRTPGSGPELKADAQPLSHSGVPDFIYLFMRDRERQRHRQTEEKQAPCKELNVGLNPGTPGSGPELKADAQPLSHSGIPKMSLKVQTGQGSPGGTAV